MKIKQSDFIKNSSVHPSLIRAVVRQIGGWNEFKETAHDVSSHGAHVGFPGFIYYSDTVLFTKRNKKAILALCEEQAKEFYYENTGPIEFIKGFNCLNNDYSYDEIAKAIYQGRGEAVTPVYNALAWYALEEVSRAYCDFEYDQGHINAPI